MIPLTVAGMGWYYTRWQQNLSDLKTMIDLVTDSTAERRKYGVAMFEYLLKNDKVPVEFVTAQINFANSASDRELLALIETAIQKASLENARVAAAVDEAFGRLPARLFVHVLDDAQRACFTALFDSLKDVDRQNIAIPAIAKVTWGGEEHELRYFKASDGERAKSIAALLASVGLTVTLKDLSATWKEAKLARPNTYELWFARAPLPLLCQIKSP